MVGSTRTARSGLTYTVALLLLALALVVVLAWKAQEAARSHRDTAERTLRDYAKFAAWEYAQRARMNLLTTTVSSLIVPLSHVNPDDPAFRLPSPESFARDVKMRMDWCGCMDSVRFFFRYDWRDGSFVTSGGDAPAEVLRWVQDTITAHPRIFPTPDGLKPLAFGSAAGGGGLRRLSVVITNDAYVNVFAHQGGRLRAVAYVLSRTSDGRPFATYGYESDAASFAGPALERVLARERLLPPSLVGETPNDSLLGVTVTDLAGDPLWRSSSRFDTTYASTDTLEAGFGRLVAHVALDPALANRLVVGGLPRSQLPLLLGLVALTAGLLVGALHQLRRQQQLARLRTDFVSGVSHELRTPLTQIRLFAELLQTDDLRSDAERRRAARVVDQEARRLTYLVENVLAFSRADRRVSHVTPEPIDLGAAVRDTLDVVAPIAAARGARVRTAVQDGVVVFADPNALRQVLLNLVDNAVKYGPMGQTVTIGARSGGDHVLRLWVEDEGPGVPEEERERIFEPYHRLRRDAESAVGGSGIGLAVVHELVTLHGGRVWAENRPGGGARFVVELTSHGRLPKMAALGPRLSALGEGSGAEGAGAESAAAERGGAESREPRAESAVSSRARQS